MKRSIIYMSGFTLFVTALLAGEYRPQGLMCNLLAKPESTVINDSLPQFGWIYIADRDNDFQTAYQILVASSLDSLKTDRGHVWDSQKTTSSQSINIAYAGPPLHANTTYFWKVRTWNSTDVASDYSAPQRFRTGEFGNKPVTDRYPLITRRISAKRFVQKKSSGHYFIDFGKAAFGTVEIQLGQITKPTSFIVHLGEKVADSTTIDRKPGGTIRYRKIPVQTLPGTTFLVITIPPDERNTGARAIKMPPEIGEVMPFRYCEIENSPVQLDKNAVTQIAVTYPFDEHAAFFECSDPVLNDVWDLCKYSIKATSFCGIYVDGDRERIPYEADAYINQLGHYGVDREYSMARYSHEYLIHHATWPTEWILHSVFMAWADYLYTGDKRSIQRYYDDLKGKTLLGLAREDGLISTKTGLVSQEILDAIHLQDTLRDIVDWPPGSFMFGGIGERDNYHMGAINTVVNAFYYRALVLMRRIAAALEKEEDAIFFENRAAKVAAAINGKLFDARQGLYKDCEDSTHTSLHANMFPLAFDLVPPAKKADVIRFIKSRGMACSVYGAHYLLEALYNAGEDEYALDLMTARHDRSWPHMLYQVGSTITLEAWDIKYKKNLDWNHAWGAAPANIIPRHLIGVQPLEPGFSVMQIKPQIGHLTFARAKVPTIRGPVKVLVQQDRTSYKLEVAIPGNSIAHIYLPSLNATGKATIDGVEHTAEILDGYAVFRNIGSGKHSFVMRKISANFD
ncbi:alpha-L-rhamnosidase [candidate division KSB1 bacterium]|nr:alpha-L-rhamnosidase [candidate division KSB1 bacterium]RQW05657.1 MAG: alpha-L-rhamnosidase [candidate division KSB1 bacterium]